MLRVLAVYETMKAVMSESVSLGFPAGGILFVLIFRSFSLFGDGCCRVLKKFRVRLQGVEMESSPRTGVC